MRRNVGLRRASPGVRAIVATILVSAAWARPTSAGFALDARYTASVTDVEDTYGVFGRVSPGAPVVGTIQYSSSSQPPGFIGSNFAYYLFPVTPEGGTSMSATVGSLTVQTSQSVLVQTYNMTDSADPSQSFYGYDFQFAYADGNTSLLNAACRPAINSAT